MDEAPLETRASPIPTAVLIIFVLVLCFLAYLIWANWQDIQREGSFVLIAASVAGIVYLLTLINIHFGIAALILLIGISPEISVANLSNLRFEDFVVPVLLFAWLTRMIANRERFTPTPLKWPIYAYLGASAISSLLGIYFGSIEPLKAVYIFGKYIIYFLIFAIILNNIKEEKEFKSMVILCIIVTVLSAIITTGETMPSVVEGKASRIMGPFGEGGNIYGGYLLLGICILIGFMLQMKRFEHKFLAGIGILIILYPFFYTLSRTGYVALLVGIAIYAIIKRLSLIPLAIAGFLLFLLTAPETVLQRAQTVTLVFTDQPPSSYAARVAQWKVSLEDMLASPLFGKGLGHLNFGDVDNEYVRVAVDSGLTGLFAFVWFIIVIVMYCLKMHNQVSDKDEFLKSYVIGYAITIFCIIVMAWGTTCFSTIRTMEMFMVLTGIFFALVANYAKWKREKLPPPPEEAEFAYLEKTESM